MLSSFIRVALLSTASVLSAGHAMAAALQASPVLIEISPGAASANVNVRNTGAAPFEVQTRVFRWVQSGGKETLEETGDVVASPPITTLRPGMNYAVRIVRANGQPVAQEEAYRIFVDQLPDQNTMRGGTVALLMRHSIPVFLMPASGGTPNISWGASTRNGRLVLHARNSGERRIRLSKVSVTLGDGKVVRFGDGLLGYVLAGSSMEWVSPSSIGGSKAGPGAKITATTDLGQVDARTAR